MARRVFNEGQEVTYQDLDAITKATEKTLLDILVPQIIKGQINRVFGQSLKVTYVNGTTVSVASGYALVEDTSQASPEPTNRLIVKSAASNHNIEAPHATQNRIDILCIKSDLVNEISDVRKFKNLATGAISDVTFVLQKKHDHAITLVKGVEDGSLAVPATPTGYLKLAELAVTNTSGIASQAAITDKRVKFSLCDHEAVVGTDSMATHATLAEAITDVLAGSRILVTDNEVINTPIDINKNNIQIEFKPGVTFSKGSAAHALKINADGIRINGGRFSGFSGGGEAGIQIEAGADFAICVGQRFLNCTNDFIDNSNNATILANVIE